MQKLMYFIFFPWIHGTWWTICLVQSRKHCNNNRPEKTDFHMRWKERNFFVFHSEIITDELNKRAGSVIFFYRLLSRVRKFYVKRRPVPFNFRSNYFGQSAALTEPYPRSFRLVHTFWQDQLGIGVLAKSSNSILNLTSRVLFSLINKTFICFNYAWHDT